VKQSLVCEVFCLGWLMMPAGIFPAAEFPERRLPQFQLQLIDGSAVRSGDLLGMVTVIDFWATWCKPCLAEIGDYNRFYREYRERGVRLLALAVDSGTDEEVKAASERLQIEYPVALPSLQDLDAFGDIPVFPTTWIVDSAGVLVREILGVPPDKHEVIRAEVERLLAGRQGR